MHSLASQWLLNYKKKNASDFFFWSFRIFVLIILLLFFYKNEFTCRSCCKKLYQPWIFFPTFEVSEEYFMPRLFLYFLFFWIIKGLEPRMPIAKSTVLAWLVVQFRSSLSKLSLMGQFENRQLLAMFKILVRIFLIWKLFDLDLVYKKKNLIPPKPALIYFCTIGSPALQLFLFCIPFCC